MFGNHPLEGVGVASQPAASRDETGGRSKRRTTSHTAPLTVAAELGIFGILLYVAFLAGAGAALLEAAARRRGARARAARRAHRPRRALAFLRRLLRGSAALGVRSASARRADARLRAGVGQARVRERVSRRDFVGCCWARSARSCSWSFRRSAPIRGTSGRARSTRPGRSRRSCAAPTAQWDPEALRAAGLLAGVLVALAALAAPLRLVWPRWLAVALTASVVCLLAVPAVVLQAGLRQSSEPWFFTNDSTYQIELAGDLAPRRRQPVRPRLLPLGARALLLARRHGHGEDARRAGRAAALRLLPRLGTDGRGVDGPAGAVVRLPLLRPPDDARRDRGGARSSRAARRASRARRRRRREPARGAGRVVRDGRRAGRALHRARVRARRAAAAALGGRRARRRRADEAVRARRAAVPRGRGLAAGAATRRAAGGRAVRGGRGGRRSSRSSSGIRARSGRTRSSTAARRTGSSATASRGCSSRPG